MSLTEHQWKALKKIQSGRPLRTENTEEGPRYWIDGEGTVWRHTAEALINRGLVEPVGDGAFGTTQTWRAAPSGDGP